MKAIIFALIILVGCSGGPGRRSVGRVDPVSVGPQPAEPGRYDKPLALVAYETVNRHLGPGTRLSGDEQEAFWETIKGLDVVWTGSIVEIGEWKPVAVPVRLQVGRKSRDWDAIVFFGGELREKLKWYREGDVITFRGALERYEATSQGVQVTVVQGRFAKPQEGGGF